MQPHQIASAENLKLRPAETVMRLSRMGSFHQSRLSFMRILLRRLKDEAWTFSRPRFDIDENGVGVGVYTAQGPDRAYSLVAFAHDLPAEKRSDRVIADAWDATFTLFDGIPTQADIDRLAQNVPYQEAGRISETELTLSRANRSVRLWEHVVEALAANRQPDVQMIQSVGYLMRTTAVYGSGKFGAADRESIAMRPEFAAPFQVEMLSVYLTRTFVRDLVQQMADHKAGGQAARLDPEIAQQLGIGNSTGLGMAPFLINHPDLLNNWVKARETAFARVLSVSAPSQEAISVFRDVLRRSAASLRAWRSVHPLQFEKLDVLWADLPKIEAYVAETGDDLVWSDLLIWAEATVGQDAQEWLVSLVLEPYGDLVDDLVMTMSVQNTSPTPLKGRMSVQDLSYHVNTQYAWALDLDWQAAENCARAWYVSEEKLEPRLGERFEEPIEAYEQPLDPGRAVARMAQDLAEFEPSACVAEFLVKYPEHRLAAARVQGLKTAPYSEIRDNTIAAKMMPIDMLRCKLSFFGAIHFDPRSDRWVRICMYNNAPYPEDLQTQDADLWVYPQETHV